MLPSLVDAALPNGQITFPRLVKGTHIDLSIPATHGALCRQDLPSSQNVDIIGPVAIPTEAHRATATMDMCIG